VATNRRGSLSSSSRVPVIANGNQPVALCEGSAFSIDEREVMNDGHLSFRRLTKFVERETGSPDTSEIRRRSASRSYWGDVHMNGATRIRQTRTCGRLP
jgi:hypothetical protein